MNLHIEVTKTTPEKSLLRHNLTYTTPDLHLAAYLYTQGMELIRLDADEGETPLFVFQDLPGRSDLVQAFTEGPLAPVDARFFTRSIMHLEEMVEQARNPISA